MSFGPGPLSPALKALIGANVLVFAAQIVGQLAGWRLDWYFGLRPDQVLGQFRIWQLATYMFLHGGMFHILFNMLALWMFGTELERIWGTRYFLKFYAVTGVGAGALTVLFSLLPFGFARDLQYSIIIGASGAIYGLLLAYGLYFPDRPIYLYLVFPIPAKYFVLIMGVLAFYSSIAERGGIANATHLSGLLVAYLFLKRGRLRLHPWAEVKYRYLKWKINRARSKFDVYQGGRSNDWNRRVH
jgi:membrane associated rhomboid family serine protease